MGPVTVTFAILLFLTITILGCYYTFIWAMRLLGYITFYAGKLLYVLSASVITVMIVIIVFAVTCLTLTEIIKMWKPKRPIEAMTALSRIFKETECVICKETPTAVLYVPCMHFCTCLICSKKVSNGNGKCPICRKKIKVMYLRIMEEIEEDDFDMNIIFNIGWLWIWLQKKENKCFFLQDFVF